MQGALRQAERVRIEIRGRLGLPPWCLAGPV